MRQGKNFVTLWQQLTNRKSQMRNQWLTGSSTVENRAAHSCPEFLHMVIWPKRHLDVFWENPYCLDEWVKLVFVSFLVLQIIYKLLMGGMPSASLYSAFISWSTLGSNMNAINSEGDNKREGYPWKILLLMSTCLSSTSNWSFVPWVLQSFCSSTSSPFLSRCWYNFSTMIHVKSFHIIGRQASGR